MDEFVAGVAEEVEEGGDGVYAEEVLCGTQTVSKIYRLEKQDM